MHVLINLPVASHHLAVFTGHCLLLMSVSALSTPKEQKAPALESGGTSNTNRLGTGPSRLMGRFQVNTYAKTKGTIHTLQWCLATLTELAREHSDKRNYYQISIVMQTLC